ncbi:MAG: HAD-IA family hydrolase [Magnetococcales bacterium]|nr:HAD-IA family hydrolase [Magnetococcales bacterium]
MIRLVIFDCDGTLVDSQAGIVSVLRQTLDDFRLGQSWSDRQLAHVVGLSLPEAMAALCPEQPADIHHQLILRYKALYQLAADRATLHTPLFPGVTDLLTTLQQSGRQMAIATGKSRRGLERTLRQHQLDPFFPPRMRMTADDAPSKPHPAMILQLLQVSCVPPDQALMVGDTTFDILMGHAAGVSTCAVTFGCHSKDQLATAQPHHWVDQLHQISLLCE